MKYYSILMKKSEVCNINVKLINGDYNYLVNLHKKNLLNEEIIKGCIQFPKRINNNKHLIDVNDLSIPLSLFISDELFSKINMIENNLLNEKNCIKIDINKKKTIYFLLLYFNEPKIEVERFRYILDSKEFNNNLNEYKNKESSFPLFIKCYLLGGMLVSEEFKNTFEKTGFDFLRFEIRYDTERPDMDYEELYIEENNIDIYDHSDEFELVKDNVSYDEGLSLLDNEGEYVITHKEFLIRGHENYDEGIFFYKTYLGTYDRHNYYGFYFMPEELKEAKWSLRKRR